MQSHISETKPNYDDSLHALLLHQAKVPHDDPLTALNFLCLRPWYISSYY